MKHLIIKPSQNADGWATNRTLIESNEFYIIVPKSGLANIKSATGGADAYSRIAKANFISPGDKSGTHQKTWIVEKDVATNLGILDRFRNS